MLSKLSGSHAAHPSSRSLQPAAAGPAAAAAAAPAAPAASRARRLPLQDWRDHKDKGTAAEVPSLLTKRTVRRRSVEPAPAGAPSQASRAIATAAVAAQDLRAHDSGFEAVAAWRQSQVEALSRSLAETRVSVASAAARSPASSQGAARGAMAQALDDDSTGFVDGLMAPYRQLLSAQGLGWVDRLETSAGGQLVPRQLAAPRLARMMDFLAEEQEAVMQPPGASAGQPLAQPFADWALALGRMLHFVRAGAALMAAQSPGAATPEAPPMPPTPEVVQSARALRGGGPSQG